MPGGHPPDLRGRKKKARTVGTATALERFDAQTRELAVLLRRPFAEIDQMAWADSVSLLEGLYAQIEQDRKFDAAIHGRELKPR